MVLAIGADPSLPEKWEALTPKGIKTGSEARKEKVGGEALFEIW